jgi:ABC-2 type transport system ATP-binding protein
LIPAIQVFCIARRFGELTAINKINLTIDAEETYGFLAPNDAGKRTLICMLAIVLPLA